MYYRHMHSTLTHTQMLKNKHTRTCTTHSYIASYTCTHAYLIRKASFQTSSNVITEEIVQPAEQEESGQSFKLISLYLDDNNLFTLLLHGM